VNGKEGALGKALSLRKRILKWNDAERPRDPIPFEVQREIRLYFQDEVDRLGEIIGRDLSHWLQPVDGSSSDASP